MNRNKFTNGFRLIAFAAMFAALLVINTGSSFAGTTHSELTGQTFSFGPSIGTVRYGGIIVVAGEGFGKGGVVNLTLEAPDQNLKDTVTLSEWQAYSDDDGSFVTSFSIESFASPTGRFIIRAASSESKFGAQTEVNALPNPSANLDQCANGSFAAPVLCTGSNWQNGNVGQNSGHYFEGDSIPYRMRFDNLTVGASNTVTLEWDTTQGGKHAIDYLTSYDRTEDAPGNNPCSGVAGAHCTNPPSTFPIPIDPNVAPVVQIPGQVFTIWGGSVTAVSAYTLSGLYTGNSSTKITITFTSNVVNPVLAWSGHIADRNDWATLGGSASDIPGSPYHMRLLELNGSGGNQDRSLSNVAVRLNTRIVIVKQANPPTPLSFGFTSTGGLGNFSLVDNSGTTDAAQDFVNLLEPASPTTVYTVTENDPSLDYYQLQALSCVVGTGGTSTTSVDVPARTATINLNYGDTVTCTFVNNVATAANASVGGRVTDSYGLPLSRSRVTILNASTGELREAYTNQFGKYRFEDVAVGDFYIVNVANRRYVFVNDTVSFTLNDVIEDLDFTALVP